MSFALMSKPRRKATASAKPMHERKSTLGQHPAKVRLGFVKSAFQPEATPLSTLPMIQAKLKIGQSNDKFEHEADRVADEVMRSPSNMGGLSVTGNQSTSHELLPSDATIRRVCSKCVTELEEESQSNPTTKTPRIVELNGPMVARFAIQSQFSLLQRQELGVEVNEEEIVQPKQHERAMQHEGFEEEETIHTKPTGVTAANNAIPSVVS